MDSVPVKGAVRSTVRMAVALLVGQALLGALIGWVVLDRSPAADGAAADRLGAPPAPLPVTGSVPVPQAALPSGGSSAPVGPGTPATRRQLPAAQRTTTPPAPPPATAAPASFPPAPSPPPVTGPPVPVNEPPASSSPPVSPNVQEPVVVGERCRPPGASGRTADGVGVRCLPGPYHRPRWKIA